MTKFHSYCFAMAVAATLTMSACSGGGGGGGAVVDNTVVPSSAGSSPAAFTSFIKGLNPNDETSEPLTVSDSFAVPDDDVDEPSALS